MLDTLDAAITAHVLWRMRITAILESGKLSALDREEVVKDGSCEIGKWIYGPGAVLKDYPEFMEFKACHARFHASIGRIIKMIDDGDRVGAKREMEHGEFAYCSQDIVSKILLLDKSVVARQGAQPGP